MGNVPLFYLWRELALFFMLPLPFSDFLFTLSLKSPFLRRLFFGRRRSEGEKKKKIDAENSCCLLVLVLVLVPCWPRRGCLLPMFMLGHDDRRRDGQKDLAALADDLVMRRGGGAERDRPANLPWPLRGRRRTLSAWMDDASLRSSAESAKGQALLLVRR